MFWLVIFVIFRASILLGRFLFFLERSCVSLLLRLCIELAHTQIVHYFIRLNNSIIQGVLAIVIIAKLRDGYQALQGLVTNFQLLVCTLSKLALMDE